MQTLLESKSHRCALANEEVHVWVADLDKTPQLQEFADTLSRDEQERAARFRFKRGRDHFIAGRGFLRAILSGYTRIPPADLQFSYGKKGKPSLARAAQFGNLNFNLAHSEGVALYAVAQNRALGIDLEKVRRVPEMNEIAARCFSREEQRTLRFLRPPEKEETFFKFWTRKEAALKCGGDGLSGLDHGPGPEPFDGVLMELKPADGYIAALAVCGKPFALKTWQFGPRSPAGLYSF